MSTEAKAIPAEVKKQIEGEAHKQRIYEPKYGGKDHSGYDTMMLYEVNDEREDCFDKGAEFGYQLAQQEITTLQQWKKEALEVMPDFHAIGKALNIPLGETVHDKILPGIIALKEEIEMRNEYYENKIDMLNRISDGKDKEIERLKALIENLFKYTDSYDPTLTVQEAWEKYQVDNGLK